MQGRAVWLQLGKIQGRPPKNLQLPVRGVVWCGWVGGGGGNRWLAREISLRRRKALHDNAAHARAKVVWVPVQVTESGCTYTTYTIQYKVGT